MDDIKKWKDIIKRVKVDKIKDVERSYMVKEKEVKRYIMKKDKEEERERKKKKEKENEERERGEGGEIK